MTDPLNQNLTSETEENATAINNDALDLNLLSSSGADEGGQGAGTVGPSVDVENLESGPQCSQKLASSSSESLCRICQVKESSSEEALVSSGCECRGYLASVHRKCLIEWVSYKGTNECEICNSTFEGVPAPTEVLGSNEREALHVLAWQLQRYQPLSRRRRSAMAAVIVFLILVTGVSTLLTVSAYTDFKHVSGDPFSTEAMVQKSHVVFCICISFLFFCATLSLGLILLWVVAECYYSYRRRTIIEQTTRNMLDARRSRNQAIRQTRV